jgi:hypothetical protein
MPPEKSAMRGRSRGGAVLGCFQRDVVGEQAQEILLELVQVVHVHVGKDREEVHIPHGLVFPHLDEEKEEEQSRNGLVS